MMKPRIAACPITAEHSMPVSAMCYEPAVLLLLLVQLSVFCIRDSELFLC